VQQVVLDMAAVAEVIEAEAVDAWDDEDAHPEKQLGDKPYSLLDFGFEPPFEDERNPVCFDYTFALRLAALGFKVEL
jgi:hypothetical protein